MKKTLLTLVMALVSCVMLMAQVTSSSVSGKITDELKEALIGATVQVTYEPTGASAGAITNANGRYSITGLVSGGPYTIKVSYIGYQTVVFEGIELPLGENLIQDAYLTENTAMLEDVVVTASANSNMRADRSGAITSVNAAKIQAVPTVSRSMNDVMRLTPTGATLGSGFSVGGGNYRSSSVTVDGAAFNNAFGIGSNLPAGGTPISLDALDQISVSTSPFDVRQSGFTGGSISAVTKSGTNDIKATAYVYNSNVHLRGNKVDDYELNRNRSHNTTYGVSVGAPIIKNKLFIFANYEYEDQINAGPSGVARKSDSDEWDKTSGNVHRPTEARMNEMRDFLITNYGYDPGRYQNYSLETPSYKFLARLDWVINDNNRVNVRYSKTHTKNSNNPSGSTSPLKNNVIYGSTSMARGSNYALTFESARYFQVQDFSSVAAEWNSKWLNGKLNNVLRATYSYQDEPREYVGGAFPTVDILEDKAVYTTFGPDPFTAGNLRQVKTFIATDEASWSYAFNNFVAGVSYETNEAVNGFAQAANGYYVYSSWDDFKNGKPAQSFGVTFNNALDGTIFQSKIKYNQFNFYLQDQMNLSDNFKLTAGLRFELPIYPELENNFNEPFSKLTFRDGKQYSTDQLPGTSLTVSPRIGFNWDLTGERKYVLRGGTGYFVGRLPMVWLVSAVGNSNCGQTQYFYNTVDDANYGQPAFKTTLSDLLKELPQLTSNVTAPSSPTIIDKDLKNPSTWKTSLAFDAKLPGDIDFSVEGMYSREIDAVTVTNEGYYWDGAYVELAPGDKRKTYKQVDCKKNAYLITNAGHGAYYSSLTFSLAKKFNFGLDMSVAYTMARAKAYGDGVGDQVSSAYYNNRYSVNGNNDTELGYGNYVSPNRVIATLSYSKAYAKNFKSSISLIYEGMNVGYGSDGYNGARTSYTLTKNVVGDYGSNGLLFIPASREDLDQWNFTDIKNGMTATEQKDAFWAYINQDDYLKEHKGEYAERGGVVMPWHNQLDLKFTQDFKINTGAKKNTLQIGIDVKNFLNLLNSEWGLYKKMNNMSPLAYDTKTGTFQYQNKAGLETWNDYKAFGSTYSISLSARYIFE